MNINISTRPTVTWDEIAQKLGIGLGPEPAANSPQARPASAPHTTLKQLMETACEDGQRTIHLTKLIGSLLQQGFDLDECTERCHRWNKGNNPPLDDDKIDSTCVSIRDADQRNHPDRYGSQPTITPLFDLQCGRVDRYLKTAPPPRRWLIKDLVVLGKVGAVIAPGGSSKSQWMLQLAVSVATGVALAGHWEVGEIGGVLVLFAEDDNDEIHRRLYRIQNHLTMVGHRAALASLAQRLFIFSTIGTDTLLTKKGNTGEVSATVTVDRLTALARQVSDLRLIVIDPGSRFRGGEENSNEDATRFVEALEKLAQQTGATVMLAHHANKNSSTTGEVSQGASRGASALTDGLRWQMNLNRPTDAQAKTFNLPTDSLGRYVAATVTKTNYSAIPAPVLLERGQDGYLSAVSATQARQNMDTTSIETILRVLGAERKPMSARSLEDQHGGLRRTLKMSKERVREVVKIAIERGYLEGGDRKPLTVTPLGADWLRCFPEPAADAVVRLKSAPRKKIQLNQ